jgi:acetylornithine deacetylase
MHVMMMQVADLVWIKGSGRYAPGQTEAGALADMRRELDALEARFPGLKAELKSEDRAGVPTMPPFEVAHPSPIVGAINRACRMVRGEDQPTGAVAPSCCYGTDAGHLHHFGKMEGIVCGPGGRYNTMPDERVDIVDFLDMIRIYMLTILEICA